MAEDPIMPMHHRSLSPCNSSTPKAAPKQVRQTSAQVQADKEKKAAEQADQELKQSQGLQDIAEHEHTLQKENEDGFLEANQPAPDVRTKTPVLGNKRQFRTVDIQDDEVDQTIQEDLLEAEMRLDDSDTDEEPRQKARKAVPKQKAPTIHNPVEAIKANLERQEGSTSTKRKGKAVDLIDRHNLSTIRTSSKKPRQGIKTGLRSVPINDQDVKEPLSVLLSISGAKDTESLDFEDDGLLEHC
ncbi:hypothetical protein FPV67DRAFT_1448516 [Lyophyllum atratum]|nr:hypothetical protein FPV67DRAFT_1448516 [Lyophyllum atratum]